MGGIDDYVRAGGGEVVGIRGGGRWAMVWIFADGCPESVIKERITVFIMRVFNTQRIIANFNSIILFQTNNIVFAPFL